MTGKNTHLNPFPAPSAKERIRITGSLPRNPILLCAYGSQLQRHLPLHLQLPVEVGDELLRALVDVVVPREDAGDRTLDGDNNVLLEPPRRRRAAAPRQAPRGRRPHAR